MTKLVLEIHRQHVLDVLLPLLKQLKVRFTRIEVPEAPAADLAEALRVVRQGCDMSTFGDALQYQQATRQERSLPFRD